MQFRAMLFSYLSVIFIFITPTQLALQPIRHHHIDLLAQQTYVASHVTSKIGLGVNSPDLRSCIDTCFAHDFCRTAVYDSQLLICSMFEECSTRGQILPNAQSTLISFLVCDDEPTSIAFVQPIKTPVPVATAMANLKWVKDLTSSASWQPFFVNEYIYVPLRNIINVYETDTYTLIRTITLTISSNIYFVRGDSQGTFIYFQGGNSTLFMYSSVTNILNSVGSSFVNFVFCYSTSFIVVTAWPWNVADVYLRSTMNNSATFIYRIDNWNKLIHCVIINDQQLIGATLLGGLQTTMLNRTIYNSTIVTVPMNTTYLPTGGIVSLDAAGRIYASSNVSAIYLPDGTLIGVHEGTRDCVGKTSKYKFIFMTTNGNRVSIYEYAP